MHTTPAPHKKNHDAHIQSWTFRNGSASKEFHLRANTERRVTIRLTLTKSTEARHMYILGVEIWKTLEEDVERERKRLKSMVTRKKDATSERHTPHLEAKDMASPLLRPRSTSHPPSVFTPAVSVGSPEASQYEPLPSPGIGTHVSVGTSSSLMTPPMSRTSSRKNGVVEDPWEFLTDAESWAGIGHGRSDDGSARMDIDPITADPSPLPSPLTPYFSQPVPTTVIHRVPDPVPSATSHSKPPLPRKANTLDIPRAGPSRPYPPFRLEIDAASDDDHVNLGWTHGRQAAHTALDTDRRTEQRFTLPDPSPAPTAHPTSSSMWSAEPPPFRGSPQPMERDTEEESSRPSSTNNDPGSAKKAPRKATGKRRRTVDAEATSMGHPLSGSEPTVGVARESPGSRPPGGRKRKSLTPGARQGNAEAGSSSSPADSTSNTRARRRATVQRTGREDSQGARRPRQGSGWGRGRVGGGEASGSRNAEGAGGYDEPPAKRRET
ncbi:hypothetical protein C8Q78DRAFT_480150 [Trametes maxima]|nr:hypothetical protein C8Q78DRAFT_480150 [Trametes maxima]